MAFYVWLCNVLGKESSMGNYKRGRNEFVCGECSKILVWFNLILQKLLSGRVVKLSVEIHRLMWGWRLNLGMVYNYILHKSNYKEFSDSLWYQKAPSLV